MIATVLPDTGAAGARALGVVMGMVMLGIGAAPVEGPAGPPDPVAPGVPAGWLCP
ncbi:hypothetical protein ACH4ND_31135 [Streptomyces sp. NPDC017179]|uniref:hypothetical protein n=1 Tax=Streptomyces sp. NPDC017179 TaxID=3364979 RepID=UPI00379916AC